MGYESQFRPFPCKFTRMKTEKRKIKRFLSESDKLKMAELYSSGEKVEKIALSFNSDPSWVVKVIKKMGVWKKKTERYKDMGVTLNDNELLSLTSFHQEKKNYREISEIMGKPYDSVRKSAARIGLEGYKRKYSLDESWLDIIDCPEKAIFLGLFFADGCNVGQNNNCELFLHKNDRDYSDRFNILFTDKPLVKRIVECYSNKKSTNQFGIQVISKKWSKNLSEYGAIPAKSLVLEWPKNLSVDLEKYFIRGFFEGDGGFCVSHRRKRVSYGICITSTKEFLLQLKNVIYENLKVNCYIYKAKKENPNNTYSLRINKKDDVKCFCDWIYSDYESYTMERKYKIYQEMLDCIFSIRH